VIPASFGAGGLSLVTQSKKDKSKKEALNADPYIVFDIFIFNVDPTITQGLVRGSSLLNPNKHMELCVTCTEHLLPSKQFSKSYLFQTATLSPELCLYCNFSM
jgi:hypothetical protein